MPPAAPPATRPAAGPTAAPSSAPKAPPSRPSTPPPAAAAKVAAPVISRVTAKVEPPRLVLNAREGWGKTSFLAHMPDPLIVMARGETGYRTLVNFGRAPEHDAVSIEEWQGLLSMLDELIARPSLPYKTIGFDAIGGFERLCHEFVCARDYRGDWGEKGFGSFQKGYDVAVTDWLQLLSRLDRLHARGIGVVLLAHAKIRNFKNPMGADFDRYTTDVHEKTTWAVTAKWADDVLFGTFVTVVDKERQGRGKGIGGTDRVLYTELRDAFDAKNRHGMPEAIDIPSDHTQVWPTIAPYFSNPLTPA